MRNSWVKAPKKERKLNKVRNMVIIGIFVIILITTITLYVTNKGARDWIDKNIFRKEINQENITSIDINPDGNEKVYAYNKYITVLNNNMLKIYNSSGKEKKSLDVQIANPIFESNNKSLVIAEEKGQKLYFISGEDIAWEEKIEGNISKIHLNKNGYTSVVITDTSYKTVVTLYSPEGKELFKTFFKSTRVIDTSISNDNKYLAIAEIDTSGTVIQSNIKVISIEKAQNDAENSVIYTYNADVNKLITNIKYQDKNKLVCMYNDSIEIIENNKNTNLESLEDKKITFISIELNNTVATIEEQSTGLLSTNTIINFKNILNDRENAYTVSEVSKEIYTNSSTVALNFGTEVYFVNTSGWLQKKYISKQEIRNIVISDNIAGIVYRDKIEIINI